MCVPFPLWICNIFYLKKITQHFFWNFNNKKVVHEIFRIPEGIPYCMILVAVPLNVFDMPIRSKAILKCLNFELNVKTYALISKMCPFYLCPRGQKQIFTSKNVQIIFIFVYRKVGNSWRKRLYITHLLALFLDKKSEV